MPKIYLSGAILGRNLSHVKKEFQQIKKEVIKVNSKFFPKKKIKVINPLELSDKPNKEWGYYMKKDIAELLKCDVLINIKNGGWEKSEGAKLERLIAKKLGIKIISLDKYLMKPVLK